MSPNAQMDSCWKDVLSSRPEGSFLFPENVVVEELLERIEDTWTTRWEGAPRLARTSSCPSSHVTSASHDSEVSTATAPTTKQPTQSKPAWLRAAYQRFQSWRQRKPKMDIDLRRLSVDDFHSLIPRYPSWAEWHDEDDAPSPFRFQ